MMPKNRKTKVLYFRLIYRLEIVDTGRILLKHSHTRK